MRQFNALLNQHYQTNRSVSNYARLLHVTANHLNALCRRALNKTASALIHERVMVEAQGVLSYSTLGVVQVGYELGLWTHRIFVHHFRKYTSTTPEVFRQR